ncbi:MAG: hypothetical protein J7M13_03175 [Synergistetes bacterium]|nr:hypothetical protein [Synergistota bacterium]
MRWIRVIFLVFILGGIGVVFFQIMSLKAGYEVDFLQKRLDRLANERQDLLLKLSELTSIERIRDYARKNGFDFPKKVMFIDIDREVKDLIKAEAFTLLR